MEWSSGWAITLGVPFQWRSRSRSRSTAWEGARCLSRPSLRAVNERGHDKRAGGVLTFGGRRAYSSASDGTASSGRGDAWASSWADAAFLR